MEHGCLVGMATMLLEKNSLLDMSEVPKLALKGKPSGLPAKPGQKAPSGQPEEPKSGTSAGQPAGLPEAAKAPAEKSAAPPPADSQAMPPGPGDGAAMQ